MTNRSLRTLTWQYGLRLTALLAVLSGTAAYAANRYVVGLDTQDTRCLDEWVYVIDTWRKPKAAEVGRGDYIAIVLTDNQTPSTAKWPSGQVMVKRTLGTPGDKVTVTTKGVRFSNQSERWNHGKGLAAVSLLGATPEKFINQYALSDGQLFMMGDNPLSYDGRYYGPIEENQIVGTVVWAF